MKPFFVFVSLAMASLSVQAEDTFFSIAGTTPIQQFERAGARAYVHRDLGRHLAIAGGYAQSEPQRGVSQGSVIARFSMPFQTSLNERVYPFAGIDQQIEAGAIEPAVFLGAGIEQQWIDQWGGFIETRYQLDREQDWHLQVGVRFWPGRAKRLDARVRSSDPDQARQDDDFNERIELSDVEQRQAQPQPEPEPEPEPEPQPEPEPVVQAEPEPEPEPVRSDSETDRFLASIMEQAKRDLPDGVYVHLGFFRQVQSIQRYRNLVTDYVWGDELLVHYDEPLNGFRVLIGPYTEPDARARRQDIREHDMDAFIYWVPQRDR
ncbi:hypothetical protein BGP77_14060 [Saccharospirillum sp. MSK14-1]|uniref:hypothetical protein n=1 Tax=Saccharospirillum sp. MSK14-1 TaxID=1897632 RepID=UPI000D3A0ED2|nr:hypothetical protein [Saccharospirillum sp. MSK14-1]PTY37612.1 hypothetical protein BGP77_14060 [Saccharospirillum sp. MSK14-1]